VQRGLAVDGLEVHVRAHLEQDLYGTRTAAACRTVQ